MSNYIKSRFVSIANALNGLWHVLKSQQNAHLHLIATVIVILTGLWLGLSIANWVFLLLVIGMVWIAEFLNTALEVIVNLASPDQHPLAKVGKDVGAAAVLIAAIIALIIGIIILGPPLIDKIWGN
jgi:diacylglycerol kinase (ATP)